MTKKEFKMSWIKGCVGALGVSALVGLALSFQACAPRSATMCVNPTTNTWVKCPAGVEPGTTLDSTQVPKTQATKKATTKKQTTTKRTNTQRR